MRRLLPLSLCAVACFSLAACDQGSVSEPETADELALFDFRNEVVPDDSSLQDDVEVRSNRDEDIGDNPDDLVLDIVDSVARDSSGTELQAISESSIADPTTGQTLCTFTDSGPFKQLRDTDGTVLYSTVGPWTFYGMPDLANKNPFQQYQELSNHLLYTFLGSNIAEGSGGSKANVAKANKAVPAGNGVLKLSLASLLDGGCGSPGMLD